MYTINAHVHTCTVHYMLTDCMLNTSTFTKPNRYVGSAFFTQTHHRKCVFRSKQYLPLTRLGVFFHILFLLNISPWQTLSRFHVPQHSTTHHRILQSKYVMHAHHRKPKLPVQTAMTATAINSTVWFTITTVQATHRHTLCVHTGPLCCLHRATSLTHCDL